MNNPWRHQTPVLNLDSFLGGLRGPLGISQERGVQSMRGYPQDSLGVRLTSETTGRT